MVYKITIKFENSGGFPHDHWHQGRPLTDSTVQERNSSILEVPKKLLVSDSQEIETPHK